LLVSARRYRASPPESSICAATALAASSLISAAITFAPSRPKSTAIALPIPDPAPVISAVLPSNLIRPSFVNDIIADGVSTAYPHHHP
jgi:hypothetical protein